MLNKKSQWVVDNLSTFNDILESKYNRGIICPICQNESKWGVPYKQPKNDYMQIICERCGYIMEFHLEHVKENFQK